MPFSSLYPPLDSKTLALWCEAAQHLPRPQQDRLKNGSITILVPKIGVLRSWVKGQTEETLLSLLTSPILTQTHLPPKATDETGHVLTEDEQSREVALYLEHVLRFLSLDTLAQRKAQSFLTSEVLVGLLNGVLKNLHAWWDTDRLAGTLAKALRAQKDPQLTQTFQKVYTSLLVNSNPWHQRMGVVGLMEASKVGKHDPAHWVATVLISPVKENAANHYYLSMSLGWALTTWWQQDPEGVEGVLEVGLKGDTVIRRRFRQKVRESLRTVKDDRLRLERLLAKG